MQPSYTLSAIKGSMTFLPLLGPLEESKPKASEIATPVQKDTQWFWSLFSSLSFLLPFTKSTLQNCIFFPASPVSTMPECRAIFLKQVPLPFLCYSGLPFTETSGTSLED